MDKNLFKNLCTPAKIYFAIAVISSIVALINGVGFGSVLIKLIFAFFWTYVLGWLCNKGYKSISWFLVLFPFILILLAILRIANNLKRREGFKEGATDSSCSCGKMSDNKCTCPSNWIPNYYKNGCEPGTEDECRRITPGIWNNGRCTGWGGYAPGDTRGCPKEDPCLPQPTKVRGGGGCGGGGGGGGPGSGPPLVHH